MVNINPIAILRNAGLLDNTFGDPGWTVRPHVGILGLSNGKTVAIIVDPNSSAAPVGAGSRDNVTRVYAYETTDKITWTLVNTLTPTAQMHADAAIDGAYSCAVGSDDSIHIVYMSTVSTLRYLKLAATTYALSLDELAGAAPASGTYLSCAIDVRTGPGGAVPVLIAAQYWKTTSGDKKGYSIFHRRSSTSAWINEQNVTTSPTDTAWADGSTWTSNSATNQYSRFSEIDVKFLPGATADTAIRFVVAYSVISTTVDNGWGLIIKSLNATAGGVTDVATIYGLNAANYETISDNSQWAKQRVLNIFPTDNDGNFLVAMGQKSSSGPGKKYYTAKFNKDGGVVTALVSHSVDGGTQIANFNYGNGILAAYYYGSGGTIYRRLFKNGAWGSAITHNNMSRGDFMGAGGMGYYTGGANWLTTPFFDIFAATWEAPQKWIVYPVLKARAPHSVSPAAGSTQTSSEPPLSMQGDVDMVQPQSLYKGVWQFATDSGFTANVKTFTSADDKFIFMLRTDVDGTYFTMSDTLSSDLQLNQGTWYVRGAQIDEYGQLGAWTAGQSFTVSHPPSAIPVSPSAPTAYGTGQISFDWEFSDSYANDSQTAFQLVVEKVSDGSVIYDSTKITSTSSSHLSASLGTGNKDISLRWKVRVWDEDDVVGAYTTPVIFKIGDAPTLVIDEPTALSEQTTPVLAAEFTPTTFSGRTITHYSVVVYQGAAIIHNSGWVTQSTPTASGVQILYSSGTGIFENDQQYSLRVSVRDSDGYETSSLVSFSTEWIPPDPGAGVAVDVSNYNVEGAGYVEVTWDDTARDPEFVNWIVYRKVDQINPNTLAVVEEGAWEPVTSVYEIETTYLARDYYAPASQKLTYRVAQVVSRFGSLVESEDLTGVSEYTDTDGYWLLEPLSIDNTAGSFRLSNVAGDSYSDEWETAEFTLAGRGRYVDQGDHLGLRGSLDAKLRDGNGTTARQKKRRLEELRLENRDLYLRTPFGDIYRVSIGNMTVGRIAGVGQSEFVDVTIPYSEVAQ